MNQNTKIAVLGGGGRTGEYLVTQLIEKGYQIKVLLRHPGIFQIKSPLIEVVHGDAIDPVAINRLIAGCTAVISTIGQRQGEPLIAEAAAKNVIQAMTDCGVSRYILVAGINIDTPFDQKGDDTLHATNWMKANFPLIQEDRQRSYKVLVDSGVSWTFVRVPLIDFIPARSEIKVNLQDCHGSKVTAANIAAFLIEQLSDDTFLRTAPFISNT